MAGRIYNRVWVQQGIDPWDAGFGDAMKRARRYLPVAVGLGLTAGLLAGSGAALERTARGSEAFSMRVDAPAAVHDLDGEPTLRWRADVAPRAELERLEVRVDGRAVEAHKDLDGGTVEVALDPLVGQPGWHFVESTIERRGGRREVVVDPVLVGRFADRSRSDASEHACALAMTVSPELIRRVVTPMLERELLPELRKVEHLGPGVELREAELELRDDAIRFELEIAGVNTLAVSGVVAVWITEAGTLEAKLVALGEVEFTGRLRNQARSVGAGGGAILGGLIAGPAAPVGAAAGWYLADRFVTKKAREVVREQTEKGLDELSGVELLPERITLIPERPASTIELGFCNLTRVRETGVVAGLWIEPTPGSADAPRFDLGARGPLDIGAAVTEDPLADGEDVRVELTIDAVNSLLHAWAETGLLAELAGEGKGLARANGELEAWTPLRLAGLRPTRPIALTPVGGPDGGWAFGVGGLTLDLSQAEATSEDLVAQWGRLSIAAAGTIQPTWDPDTGSLGLAGSLDRLHLTCVHPESSASRVDGCFVEILEAADVRSRIDAHLRPGTQRLPSFALGDLLADELGLQIGELELARPQPGVLRLSASVQPDAP